MTKGVLGKKVGMAQVFTDNGELVPATVIDITLGVVMQIKIVEDDGYSAVQLGFDDRREILSNKPEQGHTARVDTAPRRSIGGVRDAELGDTRVGDEVKTDVFAEGETVNVAGTTRSHGYQDNIHKDNQSCGPMAHDFRYYHCPGSLGIIINRVSKGMKLPGRIGGRTVTMQHLQTVKVDLDNNILLIKDNVPGANKSYITIKSSVKASTKKSPSKQHNK